MLKLLRSLILALFITLITTKPIFLYTSLAPGHLSPSPESFKFDTCEKTDLFKEEWPAHEELTLPGIRSSFLLGYFFSEIKSDKGSVIPSEYNPNDIYVQASLENYTIQTSSVFFQGIFRPGEGKKLYPNQTELAVPPLLNLSDEVKQELKDMGDEVLKKRVTVIPIHTIHKYDHLLYLYDYLNVSGCHPNDEIINNNLNSNQVIKDQTNNFIQNQGPRLTRYLNEAFNLTLTPTDLNVSVIRNFCENYLRDLNDARDLSSLSEYFNLTELNSECSSYLNKAIYQNLYFGDSENKLLKMSYSEIFGQIFRYMDKAIDKATSNKDYLHPTFVVLSHNIISNTGLLLFLKKFLGVTINETDIEFKSNSFINFLLDQDDKYSKNFIVKIDYNEEIIYQKNYDTFKETVKNVTWTQQEIFDFCNFDDIYHPEESDSSEEKSLLAWIIVFGVLFLLFTGGSIFLVIKIWFKKDLALEALGAEPIEQ